METDQYDVPLTDQDSKLDKSDSQSKYQETIDQINTTLTHQDGTIPMGQDDQDNIAKQPTNQDGKSSTDQNDNSPANQDDTANTDCSGDSSANQDCKKLEVSYVHYSHNLVTCNDGAVSHVHAISHQ